MSSVLWSATGRGGACGEMYLVDAPVGRPEMNMNRACWMDGGRWMMFGAELGSAIDGGLELGRYVSCARGEGRGASEGAIESGWRGRDLRHGEGIVQLSAGDVCVSK